VIETEAGTSHHLPLFSAADKLLHSVLSREVLAAYSAASFTAGNGFPLPLLTTPFYFLGARWVDPMLLNRFAFICLVQGNNSCFVEFLLDRLSLAKLIADHRINCTHSRGQ
jgi:hypothetical protein